jgi:hypothetical protein
MSLRHSWSIPCIAIGYSVVGYPTPTVTWYKMVDGVKQSIPPGSKYHFRAEPSDGVLDGQTVHTLTIGVVQTSDYGRYVCVGSNGEGSSPDRIIELYGKL